MYSSASEVTKQTRQNYQMPVENLGENHFFRPDVLTQAENFDIDAHFASLKGPAIEVGGPSARYHVLLGEELPKDLVATNVSNSTPWGKDERVKLLADASHLPFANQSVGSLFSSYLPKTGYTKTGETFDLRQSFLHEAARTVEPNGLLVLQGTSEDQIAYAGSLGFTPVRILETEGALPETGEYAQWDAILVKADADPNFTYSAEAIPMPVTEVASSLGTAAISGANIVAPSE